MNVNVRIARRADGTYRAWCPALPGCVVLAPTAEEVQKKIVDAVEGYVASLDVTMPRELAKCFTMENAALCA